VVVHSATKYLGSHGDTVGGVITAATEELGGEIRQARNYFGGVLSPLNAFLIARGLKTLGLRMDRHCANAQGVAEFLAGHPKVRQVFYAGLPDAPGSRVAASYLDRFGGMMSFETVEGFDWDAFEQALGFVRPWVSLGDLATLVIEHGGERRVRLSVGLEDIEDIIADLERALAAA